MTSIERLRERVTPEEMAMVETALGDLAARLPDDYRVFLAGCRD
jgi:hypothetical protein